MSRVQKAPAKGKKSEPESALTRPIEPRTKPRANRAPLQPFARCCACGDPIPASIDPARPGLTAIHHIRRGVRCPGSDAPFAAHTARPVPLPNVGVLFGPVETGEA